jgi:2,4-dienoyl-CoA reductase-like NADH-dependent reductase (Old Yellow Enzyme family)
VDSRITPGCLGLFNEATEAALKPIIASVRKHSKAAIAIQLAHAGRKASSHRPWEGGQLIPLDKGGWRAEGPSAVPHKEGEAPPIALDAKGLARVREGLSPISNKRSDRYGGSLANRMRFPLEVFEAIRATFHSDKPVGIKLPATDWVEGGWDLAQAIEFAKELKRRGIDWIDRSSGGRVAAAENSARAGLSAAVLASTRSAAPAKGPVRRHHLRRPLARRRCRRPDGWPDRREACAKSIRSRREMA